MQMIPKNILIGLVLLFVSAFGIYTFNQSNKEYIDGNILHLEYTTYNDLIEGSSFTPPWINNVLVCHLMYRTLFLADHTLHLKMQKY